jgi:hypothetical protein
MDDVYGSRQKLISRNNAGDYFFLCLFFLKRFLRLCVAILCFFLFLPLGIMFYIFTSRSDACRITGKWLTINLSEVF